MRFHYFMKLFKNKLHKKIIKEKLLYNGKYKWIFEIDFITNLKKKSNIIKNDNNRRYNTKYQ